MFALALIVCLASIVNAEDNVKTVRINSVFEDHVVTQDITDDPERNTVLIVVGEAEDFKDFKPSVNLHDFNAGYVALKDVSEGTCLLKPLPDDRREHFPGLNALSEKSGQKYVSFQKTMYWFRHPKVLEYEEVKMQAGETLAEFCRDYKTYNLIPRSVSSRSLSRKYSEENGYRRSKRCNRSCGWCINQVDGYEEDVVDKVYKGNK